MQSDQRRGASETGTIPTARVCHKERLMLGRHSAIGNRIPRFPVFWGGFPDSGFPSGRESPGIGKRAVSRSAGNRESGSESRFGGPGISLSARGH